MGLTAFMSEHKCMKVKVKTNLVLLQSGVPKNDRAIAQLSYKKLELLFRVGPYREVELNIVCDVPRSSRSSIDNFQGSRNQ